MKKRYLLILGFAVVVAGFSGCLSTDQSFNLVAPGIWRGKLILEKPVFPVTTKKDSITIVYEQFRGGELPFNFEVVYTAPDRFYIDLLNGDERIHCDSIRYGRDRSTARDTFNFYFPEYQSYIHANVRGSVMQGYWTVTTKDNYKIPFVADAGKPYRFTDRKVQPAADLSGKWATLFGVEGTEPEKAIGEFKQQDNKLTGTFRTESGDYRFLEGTIQGKQFWLSCFDGSHAFLFSGKIKGDSLQGEFQSGKNKATLWTAWRDANFELGNPDELTQTITGKTLSFSFVTPDGRTVAFPGPSFDHKIGIVTIMGTWCPNCRDEQVFLRDFLKENPELAQQITVLGASFERHKEVSAANAQLQQYRKVMNIPFDIVYAGINKNAEAAKVFPVLDKVMAFPTMMIIDKKGKIRQVHTGFDGPATSKYADFKQKFATLIKTLSQE